jgi:hypothetical protein
MNWELHFIAGLLIMLFLNDFAMVWIMAIGKEVFDWTAVITPASIWQNKAFDSVFDVLFTLLGGIIVILFTKRIRIRWR